jgi:hypothetical protein
VSYPGHGDVRRRRGVRIGVPTGRGGHGPDGEAAEGLRSVAIAGHEVEVVVPGVVGGRRSDTPQAVCRRDDGTAVGAGDDCRGATAVVAVGEGEEEAADVLLHRPVVRPYGPGVRRVRGKGPGVVRRVVVLGHGGDLGNQSSCQLHPLGGPVRVDPVALLCGRGAGVGGGGRFHGAAPAGRPVPLHGIGGHGRRDQCDYGRRRCDRGADRVAEGPTGADPMTARAVRRGMHARDTRCAMSGGGQKVVQAVSAAHREHDLAVAGFPRPVGHHSPGSRR